VKVRMVEGRYLPTGVALPTRTAGSLVAQQALSNPNRQALLADTRRADKQGCLREPAGGERAFQPAQQRLMAVDRSKKHDAERYLTGPADCTKMG